MNDPSRRILGLCVFRKIQKATCPLGTETLWCFLLLQLLRIPNMIRIAHDRFFKQASSSFVLGPSLPWEGSLDRRVGPTSDECVIRKRTDSKGSDNVTLRHPKLWILDVVLY